MACGIQYAMRRRRWNIAHVSANVQKYCGVWISGQEQKTELLHAELSKAHSLKVSSSSMPTALGGFVRFGQLSCDRGRLIDEWSVVVGICNTTCHIQHLAQNAALQIVADAALRESRAMSQRLLLSTQRDAGRAEEPRLATRACLRLHSGAVAAVESQPERDGAHYELCTWKASHRLSTALAWPILPAVSFGCMRRRHAAVALQPLVSPETMQRTTQKPCDIQHTAKLQARVTATTLIRP